MAPIAASTPVSMTQHSIQFKQDVDDEQLVRQLQQRIKLSPNNLHTSSNKPDNVSVPNLDFLWSEYSAHLQQLTQYHAEGIDIFPQAAFVVKCYNHKQHKLFINVCHDENIDPPLIQHSDNSAAHSTDSTQQQFRFPLSIGPLSSEQSDHSSIVDVVINLLKTKA